MPRRREGGNEGSRAKLVVAVGVRRRGAGQVVDDLLYVDERPILVR